MNWTERGLFWKLDSYIDVIRSNKRRRVCYLPVDPPIILQTSNDVRFLDRTVDVSMSAKDVVHDRRSAWTL